MEKNHLPLSDHNLSACWMFLVCACVALTPELVFAASPPPVLDDTIGAGLCSIIDAIENGVGRSIANLAVIFLGVGAFFGKVSWGLLVTVVVGIAGIFGASTIVQGFTGIDACPNPPTTTNALESELAEKLCGIVNAFSGQIGRGLATLAVLFLGIGAFFGKVNWALIVMTIVGIAAIFGANDIILSMTGAPPGEEGCKDTATMIGLEMTIGDTLCAIANEFRTPYGPGRGLATLAVLFLGIGVLFGKVSWAMAVMVAAGIATIFGAASIIGTVTGVYDNCFFEEIPDSVGGISYRRTVSVF